MLCRAVLYAFFSCNGPKTKAHVLLANRSKASKPEIGSDWYVSLRLKAHSAHDVESPLETNQPATKSTRSNSYLVMSSAFYGTVSTERAGRVRYGLWRICSDSLEYKVAKCTTETPFCNTNNRLFMAYIKNMEIFRKLFSLDFKGFNNNISNTVIYITFAVNQN